MFTMDRTVTQSTTTAASAVTFRRI